MNKRRKNIWWYSPLAIADEKKHGKRLNFHCNRILTEITINFWSLCKENTKRNKKKAAIFDPCSMEIGQSISQPGSTQNIRMKPMEIIEFFSISLIFILHIKYLFIRFHISWWIKFILQNWAEADCVMVRFLHNLLAAAA